MRAEVFGPEGERHLMWWRVAGELLSVVGQPVYEQKYVCGARHRRTNPSAEDFCALRKLGNSYATSNVRLCRGAPLRLQQRHPEGCTRRL
jgi:hypothetical protein